MAKAPVAGRVKTRLARGVGVIEATRVYRAMLSSLTARLAFDPRWRTSIAVSPHSALLRSGLPGKTFRVGQGSGDLGGRLQRIVRQAPRGPVVIIGTDSPAVTPADIAAAFRALGRSDAVLGPSLDGGYWLVGLRRSPASPRAFDDVRWSTGFALADTMRNLRKHTVIVLRRHADVDEAADAEKLRSLIGRRILPRA